MHGIAYVTTTVNTPYLTIAQCSFQTAGVYRNYARCTADTTTIRL